MIQKIVQRWMSEEAYKHPAVFLLGIISLGLTGGVVFNPFVMAGDFERFQLTAEQRLGKLETAVCTVQNTIEQTSLEAQIRDVSTEIFQLERIVATEESRPRDTDRLDDLRNERDTLNTRMQQYLDRPDCVPDPRNGMR
jgi:hypothetical protein